MGAMLLICDSECILSARLVFFSLFPMLLFSALSPSISSTLVLSFGVL